MALPKNKHWTATKPLPGGDFDVDMVATERQKLQDRYPLLEPDWADRLFKNYGLDSYAILGDAKSIADCGQHFGHGLTEREVDHLTRNEWAHDAQDILWRRTKLGLRMTQDEQLQLENHLRKAVAA